MHFARILIIFLCFYSLNITAKSKELIPVDYFARIPDVRNVKLSPSGDQLASLVRVDTPQKKGAVIYLLNLKTGEKTYPLFTDNKRYTINSFYWANEQILLINARFPSVRHGVATSETRILVYDIVKKRSKPLLSNNYLARLKFIPNIQSDIIDFLPEDDKHILLSLPGFSETGEPSVVKVSLSRSGKTRVIQNADKNVWQWITDVQHKVRIAVYRDKTHYIIYLLDESFEDGRKKLWEFEAFSKEHVWPIAFDLDPNILYVKALNNGFDAIFKVDLSDSNLKKELVYWSDDRDVSGSLKRSKRTKKIIGSGSTYWDDEFSEVQEVLNQSLPDNKTYITSRTVNEDKYIAFSTSDTEPGVYLLGDRRKNSLEAIAFRFKDLTPDLLNRKQAVSYKARDGLAIEGYLTLPKHKKSKNLPTIIFPHGGPISFDSDNFDYWTQFLSSRGYAVFQMNFRGSHGYGFDFMKMGLGNWGKAMQDDVEDGTRWLIEEGIADPNNICILGASYGGYAALMGTIKTPELYQCAVSFAGVSDLEALKKTGESFVGNEVNEKQLGTDEDDLWERSPLKHAKKINVPVLLLHGTKDRIVKDDQSEEMYDALKDAKKDVTYVELEKGNHYLSNSEHRLKAFKAIESFLKRNLSN